MRTFILFLLAFLSSFLAFSQKLPNRVTTIVVQLPTNGKGALRAVAASLASQGFTPHLINEDRLTVSTQPRLYQGKVGITLRAVVQGNQARLSGGYMTLGVNNAPAPIEYRKDITGGARTAWDQMQQAASRLGRILSYQ
jgi:hypothetical protein